MEIQWPLVIFTLLTGAGGWMMAGAAINEFTHKSTKDAFMPLLVALILVIIGGFASVLHLSHPDRIMNALSHPTSGIFIEAALVGIISVCAVVALIALKRNNAGLVKVFTVLSGVFGVIISFMAGYSYIVMNSHAAWDTILLPAAYLGTAAPMGLALYWALACPDEENGASFAAQVTGIAGIVGAVLCAAYCAVAGVFGTDASMYGIAAIVLTAVVAVVGLAGKNKASAGFAWVCAGCALAAGLLLRVLMWIVGSGAYGFFG